MKKLFMIFLLAMSIQMCVPDLKLDYNVTKSENYKISEKKMKKNSLEVKKAFEEDENKIKFMKTKEGIQIDPINCQKLCGMGAYFDGIYRFQKDIFTWIINS